jgi:hypothetical protein
MKKDKFERKGRRRFDTALEYDTARMMVSEHTRTTKPVVRAIAKVRARGWIQDWGKIE